MAILVKLVIVAGCYNSSTLKYNISTNISTLSPPLCQEYCLQRNFYFFAVQVCKSCIILTTYYILGFIVIFFLKKMFYQIELQMSLPIEKWFSRRYKSLESIGVQVHMQRYNTFVNRMWRGISVQCISYRFEWCQICTFVVVNFNFLIFFKLLRL